MAKKIVNNDNEIIVEPLQVVNPEINLTDSSLSITKTDNGHAVIRIKYSLEHNLVGSIEIVQDSMDRNAAQSLMKVLVAKEVLMR